MSRLRWRMGKYHFSAVLLVHPYSAGLWLTQAGESGFRLLKVKLAALLTSGLTPTG